MSFTNDFSKARFFDIFQRWRQTVKHLEAARVLAPVVLFVARVDVTLGLGADEHLTDCATLVEGLLVGRLVRLHDGRQVA